MSSGNYDPCFEFTVAQEGKYSCDPNDGGNWTGGAVGKGILIGSSYGISARTYTTWLGPSYASRVTPDMMQKVTRDIARTIYLSEYWNRLNAERLPTGVDLVVWDFGVNAGQAESARELQTVVGVRTDTIIGEVTLRAVGNYVPVPRLILTLIAAHVAHYKALNNPRFEGGWLNRQDALKAAALKMIGVV